MRTILNLSLAVLLAMLVSTARADDKSPATGTWKWSQQGPGGDREIGLKLKQDGDKVTGTVTGFQGDDQIKEGKVEGEKVTFKVTGEFAGTTRVTTYTLTINGDSIKGKAETVSSRDIAGKKAKE
jgi:hypothetical protein